jgi:hypothetical protein
MIESDPEYKGRTTMLVLPDFGRDLDFNASGNGFQDHRTGDPLSRTTWIMAMGPHIRQNMTVDRALDSVDLVPTLGALITSQLLWPRDGPSQRCSDDAWRTSRRELYAISATGAFLCDQEPSGAAAYAVDFGVSDTTTVDPVPLVLSGRARTVVPAVRSDEQNGQCVVRWPDVGFFHDNALLRASRHGVGRSSAAVQRTFDSVSVVGGSD